MHPDRSFFLQHHRNLREARLHIPRILRARDQQNIRAFGLLQTVDLVFQEHLPTDRKERFLAERPEPARLAGEDENGLHVAKNTRKNGIE